MSLSWIAENPPHWDEGKERIVAGAPDGVFGELSHKNDEVLPGEWWRVERDGETVGYGWMDCVWGDAEILLAVDAGATNAGVGSFVLGQLEQEAARRGLNYMFNVVRATHPERERVTAWLMNRGFERSHDDESLRRRVNQPA